MIENTIIKGDDLVQWIIKNRTGNAFKDFTAYEIASTLQKAAKEQVLGIIQDQYNTICAVVTGFRVDEEKIIYLTHVLGRGYLKILLNLFVHRYPGWTLQAKRKGRIITYNTEKLMRRIYNGR